jgi:hypothetical protein
MKKLVFSAFAVVCLLAVGMTVAWAETVESSHVKVTAEEDRIVVEIQFDDKVRFSVPPPKQDWFYAEPGDMVVGHSNFGNSEPYKVKESDTSVRLVFPNPTSQENGSYFVWNASKNGEKQNWLLYPWEDTGFVIVKDDDDPAHVKGLHKYFAYIKGETVRQALEEARAEDYEVAQKYHIEKGHIKADTKGLYQNAPKILNAD